MPVCGPPGGRPQAERQADAAAELPEFDKPEELDDELAAAGAGALDEDEDEDEDESDEPEPFDVDAGTLALLPERLSVR
jgi:hypothetical protein